MYNNFEISLVVFMPNITTNHAITYTNLQKWGPFLKYDMFFFLDWLFKKKLKKATALVT